MVIHATLLIAMTIMALWAVMSRSNLKATIGLALASTALSALIFRLNAPLAAVFELSVCTGLITAIFVSAISLTKPLTHKETIELSKSKLKRYWYLPVIMVIAGVILAGIRLPVAGGPLPAQPLVGVRQILWNVRELDLFGQIVIMLVGAIGVVILFREVEEDE